MPVATVLGIDPGLNRTGYGLVARQGKRLSVIEAGLIRPGPASKPIETRLAALYDGLYDLLRERRPESVALEEVFSHGRFPGAALWIAHARGVACLAAAKAGVPLHSYSPATVKQAVTGQGRATKEQVQHLVAVRLGLDGAPASNDVADALALAIAHLDATAGIALDSLSLDGGGLGRG